ncbi:unnamed protein product [Prunus armeniaca]|uniref:Uncharacterized protein n=1 Tax=Prunus armeniaca TaxID=36596 RepID=A0A6J5WTT4_PRUAR|nr:unnamed protein product [Prunus armeniaca]
MNGVRALCTVGVSMTSSVVTAAPYAFFAKAQGERTAAAVQVAEEEDVSEVGEVAEAASHAPPHPSPPPVVVVVVVLFS